MQQKLGGIGVLDTLTKSELTEALGHNVDQAVREELRGIKPIRVGQNATGTTDGTGNIAETIVPGQPDQGYLWTLRRISCDIGGTGKIKIYWGQAGATAQAGHFIGLLDVSVGFLAFSRGAALLNNGEQLVVSATGLSVVSTVFTINYQALEVPSEMVGKIVT
jgi:hypothetical protein